MDTVPLTADSGVEGRSASLPKAKDMSHHINQITKNRTPMALKELYRYATVPGMQAFAGGIPSPELFPFETISAEIQRYDSLPLERPRVPSKPKKTFMEWLFGGNLTFTIPKYAADPTDPMAIQLATSLQYQAATGPPALPKFLREYVEKVYQPGYADWDVLVDVGATDGFGKAFNMLLNMGDAVLVEEWSYPGAMNAYMPFETDRVAVRMDGEGVRAEHLEDILANWDEEKEGRRRPRIFYTVPTGQNPTGATMWHQRKKEVYAVCKKYDVVIIEDDPYFTLHCGEYHPPGKKLAPLAQRAIDAQKKEGKKGNQAFIDALPPSYLRYDTDGRVIRLDTFSKTSCPGSRLGWFTSSPLFIERLTRASEASTQAPSGFATALTTTMLTTWGFDGYIRWLRGIKATYQQRRDWMVDALGNAFHLEFADAGGFNPLVAETQFGRAVTGYARPEPGSAQAQWDEKRGAAGAAGSAGSPLGPPLISFIPPSAGMFVFLGVHLESHPEYERLGDEKLMRKLWKELAEHLVLFAPGWAFDSCGAHDIGGKGMGYFRLSFSILPYETMQSGMATFAKVLKDFMHGK